MKQKKHENKLKKIGRDVKKSWKITENEAKTKKLQVFYISALSCDSAVGWLPVLKMLIPKKIQLSVLFLFNDLYIYLLPSREKPAHCRKTKQQEHENKKAKLIYSPESIKLHLSVCCEINKVTDGILTWPAVVCRGYISSVGLTSCLITQIGSTGWSGVYGERIVFVFTPSIASLMSLIARLMASPEPFAPSAFCSSWASPELLSPDGGVLAWVSGCLGGCLRFLVTGLWSALPPSPSDWPS